MVREHVHAAGLSELVAVDSAGTGDWHIGQNANERALSTLSAAGYHLDHSARQITPEWFQHIDLAITMDSTNYTDVKSLVALTGTPSELHMMRHFDPTLAHLVEPHPELDVPDPYHGTLHDFQNVLQMIERASEGLVATLRSRHLPHKENGPG